MFINIISPEEQKVQTTISVCKTKRYLLVIPVCSFEMHCYEELLFFNRTKFLQNFT